MCVLTKLSVIKQIVSFLLVIVRFLLVFVRFLLVFVRFLPVFVRSRIKIDATRLIDELQQICM